MNPEDIREIQILKRSIINGRFWRNQEMQFGSKDGGMMGILT
jgi:hypothetical protein